MRNTAQINCPKCGEPNAYDPQFVIRPIKCGKCGESFTPGYAPLRTNYVVPPKLPSGHNVEAVISLVCGILVWFLAVLAPTLPAGMVKVVVGISPLICIVLAVALGISGIRRARNRNATGSGLAIAGMILGMLGGVFIAAAVMYSKHQAMQPDASPPEVTQSLATPGADAISSSRPPASLPGQSISLDEFNFKFDPPSRPWIQMDAKKINPISCLAFERLRPGVSFFVIAEQSGLQVANEALAEISMNNLRAVTDDCEVMDNQPQTINGVEGVRFYVRAQIHGMSLTYAFWVSAKNGYLYQLIACGGAADEETVRSEASNLWSRFHLIDPNRQSTGAAPTGEILTALNSPDFGVSMDLSGLGWRGSPQMAKAAPGAIFVGQRAKSTLLTLTAYQLGDLNPPVDYVARATCHVHQLSFDDATNIQHSSIGGIDTCAFDMNYTRHGVKYVGYFKIIRRPGFAYLLLSETTDPAEVPNLEALSDRIHLAENFAPPATELTKEQKNLHKLLLNSIGIQYENGEQFREAAEYFAKAMDHAPEITVLNNLAGAYDAAGDYPDTLAAIRRGLQLWPTQISLSAKLAKLQVLTNDLEGAEATYHGLFANDYRDDDAFHQYLILLQKRGKTDDAIAAANAYLAKVDSESISIDQAFLYDDKGQYDKAIELMRAKWAKEPTNVRIGTNLAQVLDDGHQYNEAAKLAQRLLSAGSNDADVYLVLGEAQYGLTWYRQAKDSFETGLEKSPNSAGIKKWIEITSAKLGEGDNSAIKSPVDPVTIPPVLLSDDPAHPLPAPDMSQDAWYVRRITAISFVPKEHFKTSEYRLVKVLNQHGVDNFSKFEFPFDSLAERIYLNKLEVRDEQGKVVATTDVSHCFVTDENEGQSHSFRKVLNIAVKGLKVNDTLECLVTREDISPPAKIQFSLHLLSAPYPGGLWAVYLTGKTDSVKSVQSAGLDARQIEGGWCWSLSPLPQYHEEAQQPIPDAFMPFVALGDKATTWDGVAKDYLDSIAPQMNVDGDVTALSEELTHGMTSDAQKVAAIVKYVQHDYTYTAIEFGRRALIPNKPADIIHNKYGDCKDHALLLMQLLRAASVPANLALANFDQNIQPDLPSLDQFTHMIVCVPSMMPNGFFDCTNKLSDNRSGVPVGLANRQVLLLDPVNPGLLQIPDFPAEACAINDTRTVAVSDAGILTVGEQLSLNGVEAMNFRYFFNSIAPTVRLNQMQQFLAGRGASVVMHDLKIGNLDDASQPLTMDLNYTMKNCFGLLPGQMIGSVPALVARYLLLAAPIDHRLTPFEYRYPVRLSLKSTLSFPGSFGLDGVPKTVDIADSYSAAEVQFEQSGASLTETLAFQSPPFNHPASDYNDFSQSRRKLLESLEPQLHLVKH